MKILSLFIASLCCVFTVSNAIASEMKVQKLTDNVYAIVGPLGDRSPENLGNNSTHGLVVTSEGAVLIDSGGSFKGAKKLHEAIKTVTGQPVKIVINTGGQDHRWMGNDYFKSQGAKVIANERAVVDQKARTQDQLFRLDSLLGKELDGTNPVHADETFDEEIKFTMGGEEFEIYFAGQAHTPGDSFIWLPKQKVVFTGDIVYVQRMLGVGGQSNSKSWVAAFEKMAAFKPKHVVPGHGHATTLEEATADTYDYLVSLRSTVAEFMDDGGDITAISEIDMSKFFYLKNHEMISGRNIQQVYTELEWE